MVAAIFTFLDLKFFHINIVKLTARLNVYNYKSNIYTLSNIILMTISII